MRWAKWVIVAAAALVSGVILGLQGTSPAVTDPASGLPATAESSQVTRLQKQLPGGQSNPAIIVFSRGGAVLTDADAAFVARLSFTDLALGGQVSPPVYPPSRTAALVAVPLSASASSAATVASVNAIRTRVRTGLPAGLTAQVTGGAGFAADIAQVFAGADISLLVTTVLVVAVLLLVTYRSPWLWLVPLAVVGLADRVAAGIMTILDRTTSLTLDPSTSGIVSVLVFGAGTNYALLLIARYREELRVVEDRHVAMRRALASAAPAIVASAGTVTLSLLTLTFAALTSNRTLGLAGAVGVATAFAFAILVLPAALLLFGRRLFWPFAPTAGSANPTRTGVWAHVAAFVGKRPVVVALGSVAVLGALAAGLSTVHIGLSQTQNFRQHVEAVAGQETLARAFPAGTTEPLAVVCPSSSAQQVVSTAMGTPGVASARVSAAPSTLVQVDIVVKAAPGTPAYDATLVALRSRLDAPVGGTAAVAYDKARAAAHDERLVAPLVLGVVFVILLLVLRSLVAPVVLVATVVISYFAAFGASGWLFHSLFNFPAVDDTVPLLSFLFLVALGVDYNIFLTTRAREESVAHGTHEGMATALAVTGGVITSAGVLLAAVFTVLGVLPLIVLTQIGIIVGFGVLLDTLLVRSVLVPALVNILGRWTWWPSPLHRMNR